MIAEEDPKTILEQIQVQTREANQASAMPESADTGLCKQQDLQDVRCSWVLSDVTA